MNLMVNGKQRQVADRATIARLLAECGLADARVAVELNGKVVPRAQFERVTLGDGDTLEIVALVGGG